MEFYTVPPRMPDRLNHRRRHQCRSTLPPRMVKKLQQQQQQQQQRDDACAHHRTGRDHQRRPALPPRILMRQQRDGGRTVPAAVEIRQVWDYNLAAEFCKIHWAMSCGFSVVALDTEFPGSPFLPPGVDADYRKRSVEDHYAVLRANVDGTKIVQAGVTLTDERGNLPEFDGRRAVWEFNFSDFDINRDEHCKEAVELLARHGIDFERHRKLGVDSARFANMMVLTGMMGRAAGWVTFQGGVDLAYLLKMVMGCPLPREVEQFKGCVGHYFGGMVFDVKHMMTHCRGGLYGGLDRVAETLKVEREAGESHRAGSDSLLTAMVFNKVVEVYFDGAGEACRFAGKLHNFE